MGKHRIEITMVGGHGCDRKAQEGASLAMCSIDACPDCAARRFVEKFQSGGAFNFADCGATFTHWPGTPEEVVDDLLNGTRKKGHF